MIRRLEVVYGGRARRDLDSILRYIVEGGGSVETALAFVLRIEDRCQLLGDAPRSGRQRDDLRPGLRMTVFERSAVIAYVIEKDRVRITNVFYGGRDFEAFLRNTSSEPDEG